MATKINVTRCTKRNAATTLVTVTCNSTTVGAAQDYTLAFDGADDHSGIIVHNAGSKDITLKLSDADGCSAIKNKSFSVYGGAYALIPIESGRCAKAGVVTLTVTPESGAALSACQVTIMGFVTGIVTK